MERLESPMQKNLDAFGQSVLRSEDRAAQDGQVTLALPQFVNARYQHPAMTYQDIARQKREVSS